MALYHYGMAETQEPR